jgi:hypothetical protein
MVRVTSLSVLNSNNGYQGPISSLTALGRHFIIISDMQTSMELLEKRSTVYSGRPTFTFAGKMCVINVFSAIRVQVAD